MSQTCRTLRSVTLSPDMETVAFLEFIKMSVLWERPWLYHPFYVPADVTRGVRLRINMAAARCLPHIKSWHGLCARAAKLAPWTVRIEVDSNMWGDKPCDKCSMTLEDSAQYIARAWSTLLNQSAGPYTLHPRWYVWVLGQLTQVHGTHHKATFSIQSMLDNQALRYLKGTSSAEQAHNDLPVSGTALKDHQLISVRQQQPAWLLSITQQYLIPKIRQAGFKETCAVKPKWVTLMNLGKEAYGVTINIDEAHDRVHIYGENHCCLSFDVSWGLLLRA
eukprot:Blabericola_migrator_1__2148@NODE_1593_length_4212_cov_36_797829_g1041_i0_p4_GENE_NODE_1593_length_4212_cov_36_797829_g1041_i0NODE_1593_length_4212_cov_36_797829_g1041_i0_p4_ORF_typecomplete_len277_score23_53_NODE_1593_length_4212_cov_36_797829_g1041_i012822112